LFKYVHHTIVRWFDSHAIEPSMLQKGPLRVDWLRILPFFALHAMCLGVIWVGWSWVAVGVAVALYFMRMFAITGFYHRYFSHRTFRAARPVQFLMGLAGVTAVQKGPLWWAAHHRHHHRHSDDEEDVHSPHTHGFWWSHVGWITSKQTFPTNFKAVRDLAKYPELMWLNRFDIPVVIAFAALIYGLGAWLDATWPALGTSGMQMLIWGFFISSVVLFHGTCLINSMAHLWGNRRYRTTDKSRNSFILSLITLGEGWHNNHHYYPGTVRQGFYWWEIDITYYLLRVMARLGVISDLRPVPRSVRDREEAKETGVSATPEPVISGGIKTPDLSGLLMPHPTQT